MNKFLVTACIFGLLLSSAFAQEKTPEQLREERSHTQDRCRVMDPTGTPLNVRATPNGHIVGTLNNGEQVTVLDRSSDRTGKSWVYVGNYEDSKPIGWVFLEFIACGAEHVPATKDQPLPKKVFLECGIVQTTEGYKKDEDPSYKITIDLTLDDSRNPTGLTVTHVSASGKSYIRDEQYSDSTLTNTPGKTEYFWSGKMAKNKSYTMKGTLVRTVDNKWYYTEQQFRNGKQSFAMRSACHDAGGVNG